MKKIPEGWADEILGPCIKINSAFGIFAYGKSLDLFYKSGCPLALKKIFFTMK